MLRILALIAILLFAYAILDADFQPSRSDRDWVREQVARIDPKSQALDALSVADRLEAPAVPESPQKRLVVIQINAEGQIIEQELPKPDAPHKPSLTEPEPGDPPSEVEVDPNAPDWYLRATDPGRTQVIEAVPGARRLNLPSSYRVIVGQLARSREEAVDLALNALAVDADNWLDLERYGAWRPDPDLLRQALVCREYIESDLEQRLDYANDLDPEVRTSIYRTGLLVDYSEEVREVFVQAADRALGQQRLSWTLGGIGALVVLFLSITGYLRLDDATKGYYTLPIQVGAIVFALIALGGLGLWVF